MLSSEELCQHFRTELRFSGVSVAKRGEGREEKRGNTFKKGRRDSKELWSSLQVTVGGVSVLLHPSAERNPSTCRINSSQIRLQREFGTNASAENG